MGSSQGFIAILLRAGQESDDAFDGLLVYSFWVVAEVDTLTYNEGLRMVTIYKVIQHPDH